MEQRFETFTGLILNISRCVQKIKNVEMATLGLKGSWVQCIFNLYNLGGASLTTLCDICGEDKGMMSRTIKELAAQGYVYVEQSNKKYRNPIKLTDKGIEIGRFISDKISEMLNIVSIGVNENDRNILYTSLTRISDNLTKICDNYD